MTDAAARRKGLSLRAKLIGAMVVVLAAAVGTNAYFSQRTLEHLAESENEARRADGEAAMDRLAVTIVRNIASLGPAIASADFDLLRELIDSAAETNPNVAYIVLFDEATGKVLAESEGSKPSGLDDAVRTRLMAEPRTTDIVRVRDASSSSLLLFGANVRSGDQVIAQLRLAVSTSALEADLKASIARARADARASARRQLVIAGVILLIGILIGAWQGLRISRPLRALSIQAEHIAGGDFDQRVHLKSRDELGQLADSFNTMAESLGNVLQEMAGKQALEREVELAHSIQEMMSPPPELFTLGDFSLTGRCVMAAQCGGDWWTYRQLSGGRLLVVVGDVTGHGLPAAMIAATARGVVEAIAMIDEESLSPPIMLEAIDRAIRDVNRQQLLMTCFSLVLDPVDGTIRFANAGHNFPYVLRADDEGRYKQLAVLAVRGNPLGNPNPCINAGERALQPGDVVVLTTDGLTDRIGDGGERFGDKRFRKVLKSHRQEPDGEGVMSLRDEIVGEVNTFGGAVPIDDDMTLVICEYRGDEAGAERPPIASTSGASG